MLNKQMFRFAFSPAKLKFMEKHLLSKSTFIRGLQCHKSLYLYKNRYFLRDPLPPERRAIFVRGTDVGVLAQTFFPGGVNCQPGSPFQYLKSVSKTLEIINTGSSSVIYEAAFQFDRMLIFLDILAKVNGKWNAYEIKSSRNLSEIYFMDAALQYYVLKNSGIDIDKFYLVHINGGYEFNEQLNLAELFTFVDVTTKITELQDFVAGKISELKHIISLKKSPEIDIGLHCNHPYPCDFIGHCWKKIPKGSIFELSTFSDEEKFVFYRNGIRLPEEIPENTEDAIDLKKRIELAAVKTQKPFYDKEKLGLFMQKHSGKNGFFWFLGHRPAVPVFEKFRPYDVVPVCLGFLSFQNGSPKTDFWFNENPVENSDDGFLNFVEKCGSSVESLILYHDVGLRAYLQRLIERKTDPSGKVGQLAGKLNDLSDVFSEMYFYHPGLKGNFELANVADKLAVAGSSAIAYVKSDVWAVNEFLKYAVSDNQFEKNIIVEEIINYGRFQIDNIENIYWFLLDILHDIPE